MVVSFDDENKKALLSLRQTEILMKLQSVTLDPELEKRKPANWYVLLARLELIFSASIPTFHPEYGRYMLESTPGCPYTGFARDLVSVEADMRFRRQIIRSHLKPNELPITVASWPRLGADGGDFTDPETRPDPENSPSKSSYVPAEITNPHARFP
jgi:glutamate--cysteine ligase catalytic subunit